ncbi:MAG: MoxR family ATPase [Kineosporiaceae bacterium]
MTTAAAHPVDTARAIVAGVETVLRGHHHSVELVVAAALAGGHVLLEDVPGTGKTTLARALARTLGGTFSRIQATADLLPADITGTAVWDPGQLRFTFVPGPVFAHVVLVDELNRTPPRTQSAFMEVMEEHAVTVDGVRHPVGEPFVVVATQNPLDQHGTYPLPEGQLDRFAVRVGLGTLEVADEVRVVREQLAGPTVDALAPVTDPEGLLRLRDAVRAVTVGDAVLQYAVGIVRSTRQDPRITLGASSRAAITLARTAAAWALLRGRDYVLPDDVRALAVPVLAHRIVVAGTSTLMPGFGAPAGQTPADVAATVVSELVGRVPVPVAPPVGRL